MANNSGFASGLTRGFETMDRSFARKKSQELQSQSLGLREAQAENANEYRDRSFGLQKENATHAAEMREKNYSLAQASNERVTANQAAAAELAKSADGRASEKHNSSMALDQQNRDINDSNIKDEDAQRRLRGKLATNNFDLDEEDFEAAEWLGLDFNQFIDPKGTASLDQLESVMNPESGNGLRDPGTIEAFDYIFKKRISASVGQQTKDGKTIASSRVVDTFPTEDGKFLGLELELTLDDGSTYKAPVTKGRSTSDDDNILLIPIDKAMDQVQSRVMINRALRDSPEATESVRRSIEKRLGSGKNVDLKKEKMKILEMLNKSNSERFPPLSMTQLLAEANTIMESEFGVKVPESQGNKGQPKTLGEVVGAFKEDNKGMSDEEATKKALELFPYLAPSTTKEKAPSQSTTKTPQEEKKRELFSEISLADSLLPKETQQLFSRGVDYVKDIPSRAGIASSFQKKHGRYPSDEEVAAIMAQKDGTAIASR